MPGRRIALVSMTALLAPVQATADPNIFNDLDAPTLIQARETVQETLENLASGDSGTWAVDGVARGSVTPTRTFRSASGHWCREFEERLFLTDGRQQRTLSVRCRAPDGTWKLPEG